MSKYVGVAEAADELGVDHATLRRWVVAGKVRAVKPGQKYLVDREDLERLLERTATAPKEVAPSSSTNSAWERRVYPDPYTALSEVVERFCERWEQRIETGDFDLGAFDEFAKTVTSDLEPTLSRLNEQEVRDLPEQPYSAGMPAAATGNAIGRLLDLLNPLLAALDRKLQAADVGGRALLEQLRAEQFAEAQQAKREQRTEAG